MRNPIEKAVWGAVLALALMWPTPGLASSGQSTKLDKVLQERSSASGPQDVIIRAKSGRKAAVKNKVGRRTSHYQVHGLIEAVSATS